uniref:Uncharacterized protein n=1 Tax=Arundo donax TaxID=35708 RepID=A0A0A9H3M6_ARUDO
MVKVSFRKFLYRSDTENHVFIRPPYFCAR